MISHCFFFSSISLAIKRYNSNHKQSSFQNKYILNSSIKYFAFWNKISVFQIIFGKISHHLSDFQHLKEMEYRMTSLQLCEVTRQVLINSYGTNPGYLSYSMILSDFNVWSLRNRQMFQCLIFQVDAGCSLEKIAFNISACGTRKKACLYYLKERRYPTEIRPF